MPSTMISTSRTNWACAAKLLWEVTPDFTLNTKLEFTEQEIDGRDFFGWDGVNPPAGAPASDGTAANLAQCGIDVADLEDYASVTCQDIYRQDDSTFTFTNTAEFNLGGVPITSVTSYRTLDVDIIATNFSGQAFGIAARDENLKEESTQFTQELRANFVVGDLDLIVGGFYSQYDFEVSPLIDGPFGVPGSGATYWVQSVYVRWRNAIRTAPSMYSGQFPDLCEEHDRELHHRALLGRNIFRERSMGYFRRRAFVRL